MRHASFVARVFCGDIEQSKEIFKKAIQHKGYSLVDIFQPCVTFNKINTFKWFKENTYYLDETYNPLNKIKAFEKSLESEKFPLGIFYINENKTIFEETTANKDITCIETLNRRKNRAEKLQELIKSYQFV